MNNHSQEEYFPDDPANPCANYPTKEYSSYADCDDEFVRRSLPPGLKPFWTVDNISEATHIFTMNSEEYRKHFSFNYGESLKSRKQIKNISSNPSPAFLINGYLSSPCLAPCLRTEVQVLEGTTTLRQGANTIVLMFDHTVRVKKTSVDRFSFLDSLNYFGSNLGLWPGLGLYQVLESMIGAVLAGRLLKSIFPKLFQ